MEQEGQALMQNNSGIQRRSNYPINEKKMQVFFETAQLIMSHPDM